MNVLHIPDLNPLNPHDYYLSYLYYFDFLILGFVLNHQQTLITLNLEEWAWRSGQVKG